MGKKEKSKARLDKYYYLAKEHGFRSRAAFKLIQLNKKFNFLESATCLIDLCAAPGGWLQVAAKYMPISSIKIGVDLDSIKPIHGVTTFQADITSEKCRFLIKKEIKHFKADIVLNDGAPNVGGNWTKDAFNQSELVLFALKLATEFLKEGGIYVTKIFRSSDYNSLIYVLKQLFNKVEATKPQASRNESAEIFVVCMGYKAPSFIDHKLLDPKFALKQLEDEEEMKMNAIQSIKAMFDRKTNRQGYSGKLYNERSFKEYIECANPYMYLSETNKIKIKTDDCRKYLKTMKCPIDYELYFEDLQLLGKKEVQELIIWRNKTRSKLFKKAPKTEEGEKDVPEPEDYEEKKMKEMDDELTKMDKHKKKKIEIAKKKLEKNDLRMKMSFINDQEKIADSNDVEFDQNLFDLLRKENINIEDLEYRDPDESGKIKIPKQEVEEIDLSDLDLSEEDYVEMMNEDIEENMRLFSENKKEGVKKSKSKKQIREEYRQRIRDEKKAEEDEDNSKKVTDGIVYVKKDDEDEDMLDIGEEADDKDNAAEEVEKNEEEFEYDEDESNIDMEDEKENKDNDSLDEYLSDVDAEIINPLRKKKNSFENKNNKNSDNKEPEEEENNLSYDTDEEKNKLIGKKTKRDNGSNNNKKRDSFDDILEDKSEEEYDIDDVAEIRAIAKKMLRKKDRLNILYKTYNKFAFNDLDQAPDWFVDDEKQHNVPSKPVTKEEIMTEKEALKKFNDRMPKKILEAKARKRNKLNKRMIKVKKQAQVISNQDEINELSKVKQIKKLYRKEMERHKEKKKYVVSRSFKTNNRANTRNIKHVDKRLKKDKRAVKAKDKKRKR
jgi:AdoMet-dependent rRNA methyltransferase SPB1